jgi:hypothetical protein
LHQLPLLVTKASFFQDQFEDEDTPAASTQQQAAAQQAAQHTDVEAADWAFEHPSGVQVCVFGVDHMERQPHIGENRSCGSIDLNTARTAVQDTFSNVMCGCVLGGSGSRERC